MPLGCAGTHGSGVCIGGHNLIKTCCITVEMCTGWRMDPKRHATFMRIGLNGTYGDRSGINPPIFVDLLEYVFLIHS